MGRVKGSGEGARKGKTNFFSPLPLPLPLPLSFFRPRTYCKSYYFYSPQSSTVIKSKMRLQQYHEHEQGFAHPKYACTAGYFLASYLFPHLLTKQGVKEAPYQGNALMIN